MPCATLGERVSVCTLGTVGGDALTISDAVAGDGDARDPALAELTQAHLKLAQLFGC